MNEHMIALTAQQLDAIDQVLRSAQVAIDGADAVVRGADSIVYGVLNGGTMTRETLLDLRQQCAGSRKELAEAWRQLGVVRNAVDKHRRRQQPGVS